MTTDRSREPWSGTTYNGFSGSAPPPRGPDSLYIDRPEPRRFEPEEYQHPARAKSGVSRGLVLAGVGAALGLGVLFGIVARPDLGGEQPAPPPMQPVTPAAPAAVTPPVPIEVVGPEPAPPPSAAADEQLEVLPDAMAQASRPVAAPRPPERRPPPQRQVEVAQAPPEVPAAARAPEPIRVAPPPAPRVAATAPPPVRPSFNCRYARSRSEQMVCSDPELAMLDRRLNRAFERAIDAGVPFRALRAEQDDWLAIREDAARRSPEAVASIYRQRIGELSALAEE